MIFLYLFLIFGIQAETRCRLEAKDKARRKIQTCKNKILAKNLETKDIRIYKLKLKTLMEKRRNMQRALCQKVDDFYDPNGMADMVPSVWGCPKDPFVQKILRQLNQQSIDVWTDDDVFNILLIGRTGAGKSYFANSLLGSLDPGRAKGVPFEAGSGSASVTQEVKARKGFLFNGTYDNELNFHNPLKINVFDTPGFADADLNNLRKNKLLIGTSLKMNIHLVLFVQATPRFDANVQDMLKLVNDWTLGQVWPNLLMVKGRTLFDKDSVVTRKSNGESMKSLKETSENLKVLKKRVAAEQWSKQHLENGKIVEETLSISDFSKFKVSLMNMAQLKECISNPEHRPTKDCWRMPKVDKYGDYGPKLTFTEKRVFVHEAKEFVQMLLSTKAHPIRPSLEVFRSILEKDKADFYKILDDISQNESKALGKAGRSLDIMQEFFTTCDNKANFDHCPVWLDWTEWSPCTCGKSMKTRQRKGCAQNGTNVPIGVCEDEYSDERVKDYGKCLKYQRCENDKEFVQLKQEELAARRKADTIESNYRFEAQRKHQEILDARHQAALKQAQENQRNEIEIESRNSGSSSCSFWGCLFG